MKFSDYQTIWHLCISIFAFGIIDTEYYKNPPIDLPFHNGIQALYALSFTYHVVLCFIDPAVKTMKLIQIHHATTLFLIAYSWYVNYVAYGAIIMLINDFTDVPMFILRRINKQKNPDLCLLYTSATTVVISWILLRVIYFAHLISLVFHFNLASFVCLSILWCLNVYWLYLIFAKAIRLIFLE